MKPLIHYSALAAGLLACSLSGAQNYSGYPSWSKAEALQLTQDFSPKARARLAEREAYAAYEEAMRACKSMGRAERKSCAADAKTHLKNDLSYASEIRSGQTSAGSSGAAGGSASSGMNGSGFKDSAATSAGSTRSTGSSSAAQMAPAQEMSPKEQYRLAVREAHAAYAEAVRLCKSHAGADRSSCMKEARSNRRSDLAYAKDMLQQNGLRESRGSGGGGMSGSGK